MQLLSQLTLLFVFVLHTVPTEVGWMKLPPDRLQCLSALYGWQLSHEVLIWFFQYCQFIRMIGNYMPEQQTIYFFQIWIYKIKLFVFIKICSIWHKQHHCSTQVTIFFVNFFLWVFQMHSNSDIINHNCACDFKILNINSTKVYVIGVTGLSLLMLSQSHH
jgi:hypothetical protein